MLRGKRVLVTGAGGFIGSHLTERLLEEGCCVKALMHYNSANRFGWLDDLEKPRFSELEIIAGDVRDFSQVSKAVQDVDIVFHLAAMISIPQSFKMPAEVMQINSQGTLNVLLAARESGCERVLLASTSEVYGTLISPPIEENHPLSARSPYAASKIAAEKIAESFFHAFGVPVTIVRSFNTYGPRQSPRAIIPAVTTQLLGGALNIHVGTVTTTRDFVYVKDAVEGYLRLAACEKAVGRAVNVATGIETRIEDVCSMLVAKIRPEARLVQDPQRMRPGVSEVERLIGSSRLLFELTGWKPQTALSDGIDETLAWSRQRCPAARPDHFYV